MIYKAGFLGSLRYIHTILVNGSMVMVAHIRLPGMTAVNAIPSCSYKFIRRIIPFIEMCKLYILLQFLTNSWIATCQYTNGTCTSTGVKVNNNSAHQCTHSGKNHNQLTHQFTDSQYS